jgi:hypothetical protein
MKEEGRLLLLTFKSDMPERYSAIPAKLVEVLQQDNL